jgi:hypothetical protein
MAEVRALDRELAKQSPEVVFTHPSALRDEILLTYGEKLATLERWRLNVLHALSVATPSAADPLLKLLDEIEEAKEALRAQQNSRKAN